MHLPEPNLVSLKKEAVPSSETSEQTAYTTRCKNRKHYHRLKDPPPHPERLKILLGSVTDLMSLDFQDSEEIFPP
jgi:hypothetical protein